MVITSATPWSLPFNDHTSINAAALQSSPSSSATISSLSPAPGQSAPVSGLPSPPRLAASGFRAGSSVLGYKSCCQLSLPSLSSSSSIAHLDLHTHSSRRFIEAIVSDSLLHHHPTIHKPRSAGSFRLEYESFSNWSDKGKEHCKELIELALDEGKPKPIFTTPGSSSCPAPIAHGRAGRLSFEEKPISSLPSLSNTIDTPTLVECSRECSNQGNPISSAMHWSIPMEAPIVPITLGDTLRNEQTPITTIPCSTIFTEVLAKAPCARFNIELEGDLTASDVDLLPMPGLVSLASPLYDSYLSVSPSDSRMTRISSSDYLSTANSSKPSSKLAPDYLGLPPKTLEEVNVKHSLCEPNNEVHDLGCPIIGQGASNSSDPCDIEIAASNSTMASSYVPVVEDDNFAESQSLAGLWGPQDEMNCDSDSVLNGSEGLASILIGLPHKGCTTSSNCNHEEHGIGSEFMMDELEYLMMPGKVEPASAYSARNGRLRQEAMDGFQMSTAREDHLLASVACEPEMVGHNRSASITSSHPNPNFECKEGGSSLMSGFVPHFESSQGSSILAPKNLLMRSVRSPSEASHVGIDRQSMGGSSSLPTEVERTQISIGPPCLLLGKKRPFPSFEHIPRNMAPASPRMFAPHNDMPHILASQSTSMQQEKQQLDQEMSYLSATQALSAMLYKAQGGGTGLQHRFSCASPTYINNTSGEAMRMPPSKARRRHGTAMDPQSIAARTRREKFSDRIRILQSLVPNGERLDTVSMLGQTLEYVRFLQHQVWQLYHGMDPASNIKCEKWKDFLEPPHEQAAPT